MTRPTPGAATETLYAGLPELYRDADEAQAAGPSGYPLLRYLSLVGDQLTAVLDLLNRFTYNPLDDRDNSDAPWPRYGSGTYGDGTYGGRRTADLVDPFVADARWLPFLAQLLGVTITGLTVEQARTALANPADTWAHGTRDAIIRAVRPRVAGGYVDVIAHYRGDPFTIGIVTRQNETNGVTTWGELKAAAPTWAELEAVGSWSNLEALDAVRAAISERPAGFRFTHVYLENLADEPPQPAPQAVNLLGSYGTFEAVSDVATWGPNPAFGTYPVDASHTQVVGDSTEGAASLGITWNDERGFIVHRLTGLIPGITYRVEADVKIATGATADVGLCLLFKVPDVIVRTRGQWTHVESPLYVADSTVLFIGFNTFNATTGDTCRVDNVRAVIA